MEINHDKLESLARNPRKVQLRSLLDGNLYQFSDDGAAIVADGTFPGGLRQGLIQQLGKRTLDGNPVYVLESPEPALYHGDPLANAHVMNDMFKKLMLLNMKKRDEENSKSVKGALADVRAALAHEKIDEKKIDEAIEKIESKNKKAGG